MSAFLAVIARDLRVSLRQGGDVLTLLLFFLSVGVIVPFAVGPDRALLSAIAPAMVWVAALLAQLLSHDRLFRSDFEDGTLMVFRHGSLSLEAIVFAKMIAHWLLSALPLIVAAPVLALLLGMDGGVLSMALLGLVIGTPGLVAFVTLSAAVTVGLKRGGLVAPVLILPLTLPVLIFGAGTMSVSAMGAADQAVLFLAALSLLSVALVPFAAALALKISGE